MYNKNEQYCLSRNAWLIKMWLCMLLRFFRSPNPVWYKHPCICVWEVKSTRANKRHFLTNYPRLSALEIKRENYYFACEWDDPPWNESGLWISSVNTSYPLWSASQPSVKSNRPANVHLLMGPMDVVCFRDNTTNGYLCLVASFREYIQHWWYSLTILKWVVIDSRKNANVIHHETFCSSAIIALSL